MPEIDRQAEFSLTFDGPAMDAHTIDVEEFREFLRDVTMPERKVLFRNFAEGIEVKGDEVTLSYTVPMPSDGSIREPSSDLQFVQSSPP